MPARRSTTALLVTALALTTPVLVSAQSSFTRDREGGRQIYMSACAACHGADGRGAAQPTVGFTLPLPDFTWCTFTSREPDPDWFAIVHEGGPTRGFDRLMPAFRDALTEEQMLQALAYVRGFCPDVHDWPPGDLNLPRSIATEKAFPEDEAVVTVSADAEGRGAVSTKFVYEHRLGTRDQIEVVLPFAASRTGRGSWSGGTGDLALGWKRVMFHSARSLSILSLAGEVKLPTGDEDDGQGKGFVAVEPFVSFGQAFAGDTFVQFQGGFEIPTKSGHATDAFWRFVAGKSFAQHRFGRSWSPMIELLASRELSDGERAQWDIMPEVQVSLPTRQHILMAAGVRFPITDAGTRNTKVMVYVLWDWFDGGLREGW